MMHVLVVGSGIAGLSSAYHLLKHSPSIRVTIVEASSVCGGHSKTIVHENELVDLGFQVFNRETYPTLCSIYADLGIVPVPSDMSFATELNGFCVKYGSDLMPFVKWLLRSPSEVVDFVLSKSNFHSHALSALANAGAFPSTLGEFFAGYSPVFYQRWIVPFASAVWSLRESEVAEFDVQTFLRFMLNHGFLSWSTLPWLTLRGGAQEEVDSFLRYFEKCGDRARVLTNTRAVRWVPEAKQLVVVDGTSGKEQVLSCTHMILAVPAPVAREICKSVAIPELDVFKVSSSDIVLHCDERMMPQDRESWASWNVVRSISTYWLHSIQSCRVKNQNLFVSVMSKGCDPSEFPKKVFLFCFFVGFPE